LLLKSSAGANTVRNNILYDRNASRGGIDYGDATDVADTDSDYNVLDAVTPDDSTRLTLAQWQAAGHEPHSFSATPASLFLNTALANYHLAPSSPAIDVGQTLVSVPLDLEGHARPFGLAFDIGCYEYVAPSPTSFYTLTPCRLLDTRNAIGPYGGPALTAATDRTFVLASRCGIPVSAKAVSVNVVAVSPTAGPGFLTVYPGGATLPVSSTINYTTGQIRANNSIAPLGVLGDVTVHCGQGSGTTHVVIDVNGYFQ
jgi:hypothetical protein